MYILKTFLSLLLLLCFLTSCFSKQFSEQYLKPWSELGEFNSTQPAPPHYLKTLLPFSLEQMTDHAADQTTSSATSLPKEVYQTQVLIVGGDFAARWGPLLKIELEKLGLSSYVLAQTHTGLARHYLWLTQKNDPQWHPLVLVYIPSREEMYERLFQLDDTLAIQQSLSRSRKKYWQILYDFWPKLYHFLSPQLDYLHHPMKLSQEPVADLVTYSDSEFAQKLQTHSSLYLNMLQSLLQYFAHKKTLLVGVSTPFPFLSKPQKACSFHFGVSVKKFWQEQISNFQQEKWQAILDQNKLLTQVQPWHPFTYYLKASALRALGDPERAWPYFQLSELLNCPNKQDLVLWNAVLSKEINRFHGINGDFATFMAQATMKNNAYFNDQLPNIEIMQTFATTMAQAIHGALKNNKIINNERQLLKP